MDTEMNISLSVYYTDTIKLFLFFSQYREMVGK